MPTDLETKKHGEEWWCVEVRGYSAFQRRKQKAGRVIVFSLVGGRKGRGKGRP